MTQKYKKYTFGWRASLKNVAAYIPLVLLSGKLTTKVSP